MRSVSQQVAPAVSSTLIALQKFRRTWLNTLLFFCDLYSWRQFRKGASLTKKQSGKPEAKKTNPGRVALIGAVATALAVFNMATNGEAPSQGVMILRYAFLAGGLLALAGGLIMMASARS